VGDHAWSQALAPLREKRKQQSKYVSTTPRMDSPHSSGRRCVLLPYRLEDLLPALVGRVVAVFDRLDLLSKFLVLDGGPTNALVRNELFPMK
jgi:hypothetical protein